MPPKLYSAEEVGKYLNIGMNTIYILIKTEKIRAKKVGRAYKITENSLNDFIKTLES